MQGWLCPCYADLSLNPGTLIVKGENWLLHVGLCNVWGLWLVSNILKSVLFSFHLMGRQGLSFCVCCYTVYFKLANTTRQLFIYKWYFSKRYFSSMFYFNYFCFFRVSHTVFNIGLPFLNSIISIEGFQWQQLIPIYLLIMANLTSNIALWFQFIFLWCWCFLCSQCYLTYLVWRNIYSGPLSKFWLDYLLLVYKSFL